MFKVQKLLKNKDASNLSPDPFALSEWEDTVWVEKYAEDDSLAGVAKGLAGLEEAKRLYPDHTYRLIQVFEL